MAFSKSKCENEASFVNGFIQGVTHHKNRLWKPSSVTPKKGVPLLLFLSNEDVALGRFEGWGYSFAVAEDRLTEQVEVLAWLYITDLM